MLFVVGPQHAGKPGQVHKSRELLFGKLVNSNVNIDRFVAVPISARHDSRDDRPLLMMGNIGFGLQDPESCKKQTKKNMWTTCQMYDTGVTAPAVQLKSKDMLVLEPLGEDALPGYAFKDSQNEKYQQLGQSVWEEVLKSTVGTKVGSGRYAISPLVWQGEPGRG